jgi:hypothetical protein
MDGHPHFGLFEDCDGLELLGPDADLALVDEGSSLGRNMMVLLVMPSLRVMRDLAALPSAVRGPVDFLLFSWLARICSGAAGRLRFGT